MRPAQPQSYTASLRRDPAGALAFIYERKGEICRLVGDYARASQSFNRMLAAAGIKGDAGLQAEAVAQQGSVHLFKGELDQAEERYRKALALCDGNGKGQANCHKNLGKIMQYRERRREAYGQYCVALEKYQQCGDKDGEYSVLESMVEYYTEQKEYERSLVLLSEMLSHCEGKQNIAKKGRAFQSIAKVYREKNDTVNAVRYYLLSHDIAKSISDSLSRIAH